MKGCAYADGRKQRETIKNYDAASPTVSRESVYITKSVDAHEGWDVATFDIPEAYLHTETYEDVIMFL